MSQPTDDILLKERDILRAELTDLKGCQVRYFSLSITGTGLLLAFGSRFPTGDEASPLVFLAPLAIVLPCWWIFFDKATTITRIVGYVRVLEQMLIQGEGYRGQYIGWESALGAGREHRKGDASSLVLASRRSLFRGPAAVWRMTTTTTHHRYWLINWTTFLALSVLSFSITLSGYPFPWPLDGSAVLLRDTALVFLVGFGIYAVAGATAGTVVDLVSGAKSYDANEAEWRRILGLPDKKAPGRGALLE